MSNQLHFLRLIIIAALVVIIAYGSSCTSRRSQNPYESSAYYNRTKTNKATRSTKKQPTYLKEKSSIDEKQGAFWSDSEFDNDDKTEIQTLVNSDSLKKQDLIVVSRRNQTVQGALVENEQRFAADDNLVGQNTASMIEGKLFKLIEESYNSRDYNQFMELYTLYMESFPHSSQKGFLDEKKQNFFYREDLNVEQLKGALLEIEYPGARSLDELNRYFEQIRDYGISAIQINIVQFIGTPIYLFGSFEENEGYYFKNSASYVVDNLLEKIISIAHSNHLRVYASFPLRNHPRLQDSETYISDEVWNQFQNRTSPNLKLDLLNPASKEYLKKLVDDLLEYKIDGIVFKDDFTYELNEGFSKVAQDRYTTATGRTIVFNNLFVPTTVKDKKGFDLLTSDEFEDVVNWRAKEIKQLIWDLVQYSKMQGSKTDIGIEVKPELLLAQLDPVKWYSTSLHYLKDLNVDFFILKEEDKSGQFDSVSERYELALESLRNSIPSKREIFLKVPLSHSTKNVIEFNKHVALRSEYKHEFDGIKIAVGPVNRLKRLDIVN